VGGEAGWLKVVVGIRSSIIFVFLYHFCSCWQSCCCRSDADLFCITALFNVLRAGDENMRSNQSPREHHERLDASGESKSTTRLPRP
jgi:hypothetical protein